MLIIRIPNVQKILSKGKYDSIELIEKQKVLNKNAANNLNNLQLIDRYSYCYPKWQVEVKSSNTGKTVAEVRDENGYLAYSFRRKVFKPQNTMLFNDYKMLPLLNYVYEKLGFPYRIAIISTTYDFLSNYFIELAANKEPLSMVNMAIVLDADDNTKFYGAFGYYSHINDLLKDKELPKVSYNQLCLFSKRYKIFNIQDRDFFQADVLNHLQYDDIVSCQLIKNSSPLRVKLVSNIIDVRQISKILLHDENKLINLLDKDNPAYSSSVSCSCKITINKPIIYTFTFDLTSQHSEKLIALKKNNINVNSSLKNTNNYKPIMPNDKNLNTLFKYLNPLSLEHKYFYTNHKLLEVTGYGQINKNYEVKLNEEL